MAIPILLGITASIAAYKTPELIRLLQEKNCEIKIVLSFGAKEFVTPLTLQTLSNNPVYEALLDASAENTMSHIALARWAQRILIAPASANFIAKLSCGIADDLLTTLCLATQAPLFLAPAMNQAMWANPATQHNFKTLLSRGIQFIGPTEGVQACGEFGLGRMAEPEEIANQLLFSIEKPLLAGQKILITAGPTQEALDPIRFLTNRSSGKMGYALAKTALALGADVTLISGPTALSPPPHCKFIPLKTAKEMLSAVENEIEHHTVFISTAAVSDYYLPSPALQKIKKEKTTLTLSLEPTPDILSLMSHRTPRPYCVGFAAETQYSLADIQEKKIKKACDILVVNDVSREDIGFEKEDNALTVLTENEIIHLEKTSKMNIAQQLLKIISEKIKEKSNVL
ncbi:MAG: hypothetical protein ACD_44C00183G0002 [uncultured bacterium]|nr:MAG: hypothetical protein ACD_44C00183G0002 [uncultured bacterium]